MNIFKSIPQEGAIERGWTNETLTLDLTNSLNEKFHFEIQPSEKDNLPTRASDTPFTNSRRSENPRAVIVNTTLPI